MISSLQGIDFTKYSGIATDSRRVVSGNIYFALSGTAFNGEDFIPQAIENGASLIVVNEQSNYRNTSVQVITCANQRQQLAFTAAQFYDAQPSNIVAITGTNGKTSCAYFYKQFAELLGKRSACIGTLGLVSNFTSAHHFGEVLTSPDAITLHNLLKQLADEDIQYVALEASSHGLDQYRMDGVKLKAASFTNFTQDHLDYHNTMDAYFNAKMRLFTDLLTDGVAILNADIPEYEKMKSLIGNRNQVLSYGKNSYEYKLVSFQDHKLELEILGRNIKSEVFLNGYFQAQNLLNSMMLGMATGLDLDGMINALPEIKAAPGRLELVAEHNGARIFLDYAHTPDALEKALQNLRIECKGRLIVLFGCGGNRDVKKRPIMGAVAAKYADLVFVSDDNPRYEDPSQIRKEVLIGCPEALDAGSRAEAIHCAISCLKPQDILLVAGKGHETYQVIGDQKIYFSDTEEIIKIIDSLEL